MDPPSARRGPGAVARRIAAAAAESAAAVDSTAFAAFLEEARRARQVLFYGAGRTGLMARAAVVRWRHLGLHAWYVGEAATPPIAEGDLAVVCSGSGRTPTSLAVARAARKARARLAFVTEEGRAPKGVLPDLLVEIPLGERKAAAPMGSVFEHALLLLLDAAAVHLIESLGERPPELRRRHANLT